NAARNNCDRQSRQRRFRPGRPEHEPDARLRRSRRPPKRRPRPLEKIAQSPASDNLANQIRGAALVWIREFFLLVLNLTVVVSFYPLRNIFLSNVGCADANLPTVSGFRLSERRIGTARVS